MATYEITFNDKTNLGKSLLALLDKNKKYIKLKGPIQMTDGSGQDNLNVPNMPNKSNVPSEPNMPNELNKPNVLNVDDSNLESWGFLKVGNRWEYEEGVFNENSELEGDKLPIIEEITNIDGEHISYGNGFWTGYVNDTFWGWNDDFPYVFKDSYVGKKHTMYDGFVTLEVLSVNETVDVPGGTFSNCIKTKRFYDDPYEENIIIYSYYSKKYGLIMERYEYKNGRSRIKRLKSYNIKL